MKFVSKLVKDDGGTNQRRRLSEAIVISVSMLKMVKEQLLY